MLVVLSDTHGTDGPRLDGPIAAAVDRAEVVVHAGDLTTEAAFSGFERAADRLVAVHGNADDDAVCERLPTATVLTYGGRRVAVTHRREGGTMALRLFGRERGADLVVFGHTHRPTVLDGDPTLLNPGSHADPRGHVPAHAELRVAEGGDGLVGDLVGPAGTLEAFRV